MKRFLDTNVLVYSISSDPSERTKCEIAQRVLLERDNALSVQVLQEFYVQATRATRPAALTHETAVNLIRVWMRFPVQDMTVALLGDALEIKAAHRLSYWDAAIVAAARALGCGELVSEDMAHGQTVAGVRIVNPFR
jgi:predicted nucleic acid-binding protein